ncbi:MAG: 16S rRNA (adenine(1518)-N(6)/adenine(1519)-N(6))-dimethyltransferase, partial [Treponemataceae bacterium]|nr:16S rRNA (adenine(1518)-N(6)/adenine(1519)-N(6))-dimethyltransferase [Treponemataceae bacterium]
EVAQRMEAKPSEKDYSSFSVLCQWAYDVKTICDLGRANFWPRPNVDSRSVLFTKKSDFPLCKNPDFFVKFQRALFSNRRKTVKNNLQSFLRSCNSNGNAEEILLAAKVKESARAEELCVEELLHLSDFANDAIL